MVKPLTETEHLQEHFKTSQRKAIVARLNFGVQNPKF